MEDKNMNQNQEADQNPVTPDSENESNIPEENCAAGEACKDACCEETTGENKKEENENTDMKLIKENERLKKELEEQKDKYLRLFAEFDNYRKRTQKEKTDAYTDAKIDTVKAFLPLLDNMEKAQEFAKDDKNIQVILKQLEDILKALDVKAIESDGKQFDPNFHEALVHEEDDSKEENKIVQTFMKGYMLGDKVIRHSLVKVLN